MVGCLREKLPIQKPPTFAGAMSPLGSVLAQIAEYTGLQRSCSFSAMFHFFLGGVANWNRGIRTQQYFCFPDQIQPSLLSRKGGINALHLAKRQGTQTWTHTASTEIVAHTGTLLHTHTDTHTRSHRHMHVHTL